MNNSAGNVGGIRTVKLPGNTLGRGNRCVVISKGATTGMVVCCFGPKIRLARLRVCCAVSPISHRIAPGSDRISSCCFSGFAVTLTTCSRFKTRELYGCGPSFAGLLCYRGRRGNGFALLAYWGAAPLANWSYSLGRRQQTRETPARDRIQLKPTPGSAVRAFRRGTPPPGLRLPSLTWFRRVGRSIS